MSKIVESILDLSTISKTQIVVFTNGCFDILHEGHFHILQASKNLGDILIVGLNSDSSVRQLKGNKRPINPWRHRAQALANLKYVDLVVKFDELTPINLIAHIRPNIITKGGDYSLDKMIGRDIVESYGGSVKILPFLEGFSTTKILENKVQN